VEQELLTLTEAPEFTSGSLLGSCMFLNRYEKKV
jgi:hypothetical protein